MLHSKISTFLLLISVVLLLVASKPNVPRSSDGRGESSSFPSEPPLELKGILPPATFAQLTAVHQDQSLTIPQKMVKIDEIINALPEDVLQQLPLPPVFRLLPQDVQEMIKTVRVAKNLTVQEKWLQTTIIIESLPKEQRQMLQQMTPGFPPRHLLVGKDTIYLLLLPKPNPQWKDLVLLHRTEAPSPEFKDILPKEAWDQLVAVYQNTNLDNAEKMTRIDEIIDALPNSIREKLPLSPLRKLPADIQQKLQAIHMQRGLSAEQRYQKIKAIIESLPLNMKKLMSPH